MPSESENPDPFRPLKWSDIEEWAGSRATSKGEDYQRSGRVEEIKRTQEGGLLAMVRGRREYFTEVSLEAGELSSVCTCPVGGDCKHGVATVLEYLNLLQHGIKVPLLSENDLLLLRVRRMHEGPEAFESRKTRKSSRPPLREWLDGLEKAELIDILVEFSEKSPSLGSYLRDRQDLETEDIGGIVRGISSELDLLWEEAQEYDPWSYESTMPDFSNVQNRMESLLDSGHYDELVDIGKGIMNRYDDIMEYDQEGEIAMELSNCMSIVFEALSGSPSPAHERMFEAFEFELKDEYDVIGEHAFWGEDFSRENWKNFAEILKTRLREIDEGYCPDYSSWDRKRVADRLVRALKNAGLFEEAIPICEREAEATGSYDRLVGVLLEAGRKEKAVEWIYRGIGKTREEKPGMAHSLRNLLIETKEKEGDLFFAAALQAEEFFRGPELSSYLKMRETSEKAGVWQEVREIAHRYLEKGDMPAVRAKNRAETSILPGVLPVTGLLEPDSFEDIKPPVLDLLIKIAIEEKAPDEVIRWYEELKKEGEAAKSYAYYIDENKITNAVHEKSPDIAIEIWKKLAEELIFKTKVDAYREAAVHLRKIKETMEAGRQKGEWKTYLKEIRDENRRKRRLIEILDTLEKDRIIEE
ncbi:TPA: SWIM zinc finger domain-containing protein [Methanosarcinaceae archaeon]|nr:SWIM zinc finger domain-containing protein [Methanosarcinaceae archaeon]